MVNHLGFYECYMYVFIHATNAQIIWAKWLIIWTPYNMGYSRGFEVKNKSTIPDDIGLQYRVCWTDTRRFFTDNATDPSEKVYK